MDEFIGMIKIFGGNYAPKDWAFCDGSIFTISSNTALFSILGTQYGGNGTTTFAIPNLMGRVPVGFGQGQGLSSYNIGDFGGTTNVALSQQEMPPHNHSFVVSSANATQAIPEQNVGTIGTPCTGAGRSIVQSNGFNMSPPNTILHQASLLSNGGNQPHNNMQPYLGLNYIICLRGIFPPHS